MVTDAQLVNAAALTLKIHAEFGRVVTESTIRQWVSRGQIESKGRDPSGRSMFDWPDVAYLLARRGH